MPILLALAIPCLKNRTTAPKVGNLFHKSLRVLPKAEEVLPIASKTTARDADAMYGHRAEWIRHAHLHLPAAPLNFAATSITSTICPAGQMHARYRR